MKETKSKSEQKKYVAPRQVSSAKKTKVHEVWDLVCGSNDTGTIVGILIMIVPFVLSMITWTAVSKKWGLSTQTTFTLTPNLSTTLVGALIYGSYLLRYGFFKKDSIADVFWTVVQGVLDMWVLASLCSIVVGGKPWQIPFINVDRSAILIFTIVMSWVGMKSVAGFMWVFLILGAIPRLTDANTTMGMAGAVFIIATVLGFVLQIKNLLSVQELSSDFKFTVSQDIKASGQATKNGARKAGRAAAVIAAGAAGGAAGAAAAAKITSRDDDKTIVAE